MSTLWALLIGCSLHFGVLPSAGAWSVGSVLAPVAEPDVDDWARESVTSALASRRALDPAAPGVTITVSEAAWTPARRSGGVLLYDARLTLTLQAGERVVARTRTRTVVDPGDAAGARALREATLRALAREVADDAVAGLTAP
jgi:hypothetical protein